LNLAGIAGAVMAAIPGIIDFIYTVPPESSAKKRAATHGIANTCMLLIFTGAYFYRDNNNTSYSLLALELAGITLLFISGWLGGTLVYRNQVGVDPRYANAGKWKEEHYKEQGEIEIGPLDQLGVNQMKLLHIGGKRIVLGRTEERYVAFDDHCTHKGGSLAGGSMICGKVQCPWHGSQFDCATGQVCSGPAEGNINVYPLSVRNNRLILHYRLPEAVIS
jgi:nitrite reductase/ring-hydroxylating ferredoxin subunit